MPSETGAQNSLPYVCRVVIIGAGLAGVATAIGLRRAGHEVLLLERVPEFDWTSSQIHLPPNACRALQQLDVLERVEKFAIPLHDITLLSYKDGCPLRSLNLMPYTKEKYGMPYLSVHRGIFHKCLVGVAKELDIEINMGCSISSIDFDAASVHLQDGRSFLADLVLGSDGENSQCRSLLLGRPDPPRHFGHLLFSCNVAVEDMLQDDVLRDMATSSGVSYWLGPDTICLATVNRVEHCCNILGGIKEPETSRIRAHPYPSNTKVISANHKNWDPVVRKLIDLSPLAMNFTITTSKFLKTWSHHSGKFTLLGDAAHAMTPYMSQGAAQSMEDAAVMSLLLGMMRHREQVPDIIRLFEDLRKGRALRLKQVSEEARDIYCIPDGPIQEERDRQLREEEPYPGYAIPWLDPDFQSWMYTYDAQKETSAAWQKYLQGKWPMTRGLWRNNGD